MQRINPMMMPFEKSNVPLITFLIYILPTVNFLWASLKEVFLAHRVFQAPRAGSSHRD